MARVRRCLALVLFGFPIQAFAGTALKQQDYGEAQVADSKVLLSTAAISGGKFGDTQVGISTAAVSGVFGDSQVSVSTKAVSSGKFGDANVSISTGAVVAGKFGDNRVQITSGAVSGIGCFVGSGVEAVLCKGSANTASGTDSTISGGVNNTANGQNSTVGGGASNQASNTASVVAGGSGNTAPDNYSSVTGGNGNHANGANAFIGGGGSNATGASASYETISGGNNNTCIGQFSTIPGGSANSTNADYTFAAGRQATANSQGCFVWADSTNAAFTCSTIDQTIFRASGGFGIGTTVTPSTLTVAGRIESTKLGFKFPDGGVMTSTNPFAQLGLANTFTATNTFSTQLLATSVSTYSIRSSSGIYVIAGGITWPDGSVSTSAPILSIPSVLTVSTLTATVQVLTPLITPPAGNGVGINMTGNDTPSGGGGTLIYTAGDSNNKNDKGAQITIEGGQSGSHRGGSVILSPGGATISTGSVQIVINGVLTGKFNSDGLFVSSSIAPSVACDAGTASVNSTATNQHGTFTAGAAATNCTVTFSAGWPKAPDCICHDQTSLVVVRASAVSGSSLTCAGATISNDVITYLCMGAP